jgi:tetratricopeptide (TPR) repeat protein
MNLPEHQNNASGAFKFARALSNPVCLCLLLVAVTWVVYWPVMRCDFVNYDDPDYFSSNPRVQAGLTPGNVVWAFRTGHAGNWHPLTWLSLMLDVTLFGPGPAGPHFTNLLFHLVDTVLVFLLLRRLTATTWRSALVAALFALHPLHVESVAWISERKDVLSTFFGLLTLLFYAGYAQKRSRVEGRESRANTAVPALDPRPSALDYSLALLFFALGLMSKPMLVTLPFLMLLLDYWPLNRGTSGQPSPGFGPASKWQVARVRSLVWEKIPFFVLSMISCVVTFIAQQKGGAVVKLVKMSLAQRMENTFVAYARYLAKTFWPSPLANPYPYPEHWDELLAIYAVALIIGLCAVAGLHARRFPFAATGWFWFVGMLVPVIGLVQVGNQSLADRYTYLPLIGIFMVAVWGLAGMCASWRLPKPVAGILAVVLLTACGLRTRDQIGYWQNSGTLFRHTLAVTENNFVACNNLGTWLSANGQTAEAVDYFQKSLRIEPHDSEALYNLGNALMKLGDLDAAVASYRRALGLTPARADIWNNLGFALSARKQYDEAIAGFEAALKLNPEYADAHNNLATVLFIQKRFDEAVRHYREAVRVEPSNPQIHCNLGDALVKQGRPAEAVQSYQEALRLKPDNARVKAKLQALGAPVTN